VKLILIGLIAGLASGLLGVGGGIVMVPLLVWASSFDQKRAHATSLAAIVPIAAAGAAVYATDLSVDLGIGIALALGTIVGAPIGARLLARSSDATLKIAFGVLQLVIGISMVWP
jgi:uncharacterized membrane protein YfcA